MLVKETILDVLLYLFENYFDDELEESTDQVALEAELKAAGFPPAEVQKAFDWLADLEASRKRPGTIASAAVRCFSDAERARLSTGCVDLLMRLERLGILTSDSRETVIERLMALNDPDIDAEKAKWVVLMVLFAHPGEEDAFARMEDLVFDTAGLNLH